MKKSIIIFLTIILIISSLLASEKIFKVIEEKCISCKICVKVCPVNAIKMENGKAIINTDKCINCGICENKCPTEAIVKEAPAKKTQAVPKKVETQEKTTIFSILKQKCIGCNLCIKSCPVNAIEMVNGKAVIDQEKCIDCGICINGNGNDYKGCPVKAIEKKEE